MRTYCEWEELLLARDIPVGAINDLAHVVEHPRGVFHDVQHPSAGPVRVAGSPVRLSKTPACVPTPSPRLGEHTSEVVGEILGLSDAQIDAYATGGAFGKPSSKS
jgi:crotonobetainyl-CoA:carnitine CoA-transferase CaiB-like acyl-CoA transferase